MKHAHWCLLPLLMLVVSGTPGCTTKSADRVTPVPPVGPASFEWVRTELYFSIGDWMESALSTEAESRWAEFLDREVTPRFPGGLTAIEAYGQWRSPKSGSPLLRERSRVLVIVHPPTQEASEKIEAIRAAWKSAAKEASVLRVSQPADVRF